MNDLAIFVALTTVMGLSIFLSLPVILLKGTRSRTIVFLGAASIGILIFLLADIFSNIAPLIASNSAYLTNPGLDVLFVVAVAGMYVALYGIEQRRPMETSQAEQTRGGTASEGNPMRLAGIIALGIGLQNLTEGLVFGASWVAGQVGLLLVVFLGFFLQNITEGFPIVSPFLGTESYRIKVVVGLFFLAGIPTILGGAIGYFFTSVPLVVAFGALAVGAILYVLAPMLRFALRPEPSPLATYLKHRLVLFGILTGFVVGFAVNAI